MSAFALVGVPIDSVGRSGGAELSPTVLRDLGLTEAIGAEDRGDLDVSIRGDERDVETGIVASPDVLAATATIRASVAEVISEGSRPLLLGGCCAELPGALAGARDALGEVGLVHLDGHLDLYDGTTSPTGEAADMPVSVVLGRGPRQWVEAAGGASTAPERTAIVGYRDREESLRYGMAQPEEVGPELSHTSVEGVRAEGPSEAARRIAASLAAQAPFWLHFDVDVLDEGVFPATDYLMPNGMTLEELLGVLRPLTSSPALIGASLACYNPEKDDGLACGRALVQTLEAAMASGRS
ncbi:MAG TPA: arginase family protein [Solirubrobacterales bacterium]|jgi:arginase